MKAIVIVDENWNIGKEGGLLAHLPGDLKYYKEKTLGNVIVIGRKTLESFPGQKPLPGRINLVLTSNKEIKNDDCEICLGLEELRREMAKYPTDKIWISGGEMVYNLFLDECSEVYVTKMQKSFDADKSFRNLDQDENFVLKERSNLIIEKGIGYKFEKYERRK